MINIKTPITKKEIKVLKAGDAVLLSGIIYTARDQAHKKLVELIEQNKKLPLELKNQIVYYCGPTATPPGKSIGSCGPTTSSRMDPFVEPLFKQGLLGMIGKGRRSKKVRDFVKKYNGIYFISPSGCGALLAGKVLSKTVVGFKELGPEAIYRLEVKDFPLIVSIDPFGKSILGDV
ncbi:MAG: fumarate hydratase C-terminal domain-containing protein [Candidatus Omnitrophica bacterium]|nr:fumarate hydratase C-terminal domain-containing protein [Candidatus Omnitrophota bacterium]MCK5393538.1 fumarate hydratase C-terminal domain-containing protein [Candidatus Omnitrophota bacterium]